MRGFKADLYLEFGLSQTDPSFSNVYSNPLNSRLINRGNLTAMAKVKVNDTYVGGVWTYPYKLDISDFARPGKNELEIELVNNWMNRLIGDQNILEAQRETWCFVNPYNAQSRLQPSGLFGPVTIQSVKYQCVRPFA